MPDRRRLKKPWTVAVYMISDGLGGSSALDASAEKAKDEIGRALAASGAAASVHVAIQMDFKEKPGTRRLIVHRDQDWSRLGRKENAGNPHVLEGFLRWVHKECPAERYAVHFWGHSSGPVGLFFEQSSPKAPPDGLTLPELGYAFQHAKKILGQHVDIVLLKDCWMATLEAACELRDGANFMVASQSLVPIEGWPYEQMFACLSTEDTPTVAAGLVNALGEYYDVAKNRPQLSEVPFAAVDVEAARAIDEPLRALAARLGALHGARFDASRGAIHRSSRGDPALVDIVTMCRRLRTPADDELDAHADDLIQAVRGSVITRRPDPSVFQGLSLLYFPPGATPEKQELDSFIVPPFFVAGLDAAGNYRTLELSRNTGWQRVGLENYRRSSPKRAKGEHAVLQAAQTNKGDDFGIDWNVDDEGTLTIQVKKKKPKGKKKPSAPKPKPKPKPKKK